MLPTLFWSQIHNIAPYKLLWRKLTLSQPKPVHVAFIFSYVKSRSVWSAHDFCNWKHCKVKGWSRTVCCACKLIITTNVVFIQYSGLNPSRRARLRIQSAMGNTERALRCLSWTCLTTEFCCWTIIKLPVHLGSYVFFGLLYTLWLLFILFMKLYAVNCVMVCFFF